MIHKNNICTETYNDALSWSPERRIAEAAALANYMNEHWSVMSLKNQDVILREYRAIQNAMRERLASASG